MNFETFFRFISYAAVFCGFLALWVSGTFGIVGTAVFVAVIVGAWLIEGSRWQISERWGTALIVLALPAYYLAFKFKLISFIGSDTIIAGVLARMILTLSAIKLLQKKGDRDWIFLYLMSFFEVLLAAGLSISALYLVTFLVYSLLIVCSIIAYEMRKTAREVENKIRGFTETKATRELTPHLFLRVRKLPLTAVVLIVFITALSTPLFFMLPRVGGAGLGGNQRGLSTSTGFSDSVKLGGIGNIQQNDEIVMRVRAESGTDKLGAEYFRGVALDRFDGKTWSKSRPNTKEPFVKGESDLIQIDSTSDRENLFLQAVILEPLDTPVLFAMPRAIAFQGTFPMLYKDSYGAINYAWNSERISYKVLSDRSQPSIERLRLDNIAYGEGLRNYLQLPLDEDRRIFELAYKVVGNSSNRYDKAKSIEKYLQNNFGYTLDQKAGGEQPLSDFLFNIREGHCEYFATSMAIMLRTQGIATRIVNGFHGGEYNDSIDMTVIRQRHAHSWVEVYFPKEDSWVTFDPTPFSGDGGERGSLTGFSGTFSKYIEAIDTIWIQYFVAFDTQEQHSLARSMRSRFAKYQTDISSYLGHIQDVILTEWWAEIRGDKGNQARILAGGYLIGGLAGVFILFFLLRVFYRKLIKLGIWQRLREHLFAKPTTSIVEFYDRMLRLLADKGIIRELSQTPLEFAFATNMPVAVQITEKYNGVRFGGKDLSREESAEIDDWLVELDNIDVLPTNSNK